MAKDAQIDLETIGLFSNVSALCMEVSLGCHFDVPLSKPKNIRRRSWALLWQGIMVGCLIGLAFLNPRLRSHILLACQCWWLLPRPVRMQFWMHIEEILPDAELGLGSSIFVNAYRLSSIIPESGTHHCRSSQLAMVISNGGRLPSSVDDHDMSSSEIEVPKQVDNPSIQEVFWDPLRDFLADMVKKCSTHSKFHALLQTGWLHGSCIGQSVLPRLGIYKVHWPLQWKWLPYGPRCWWLNGGIWMLKLGIQRSLWIFGWFQLITVTGFYWLAMDSTILPLHTKFSRSVRRESPVNKDWYQTPVYCLLSYQYLGVGLGTTAFVAFIAQNTNKQFSAAQYAILTSISGLQNTGRIYIWLVCHAMGYPNFLNVYIIGIPWTGIGHYNQTFHIIGRNNSHQQDDLD